MPRNAIKSSLQDLKAELVPILEETGDSNLEPIQKKLDAILEEIDETNDSNLRSLVENLNDSIYEAEVSHPRITAFTNQIMSLLSNLGI
jgi:F420-dependent methylenetetrahydromethanopterin dehydrogenase